ncbi:darobactin export ABC transporter periplasmic adaptor subunit [Acerihabitans arboris]|uniref:Darobactin export ABC transporter periplasmic adaptor subunit n=1 Tax=Acerihabitans arboris TaxID=2691583 RepID=A0A845S9Y7_9GAMM|nr:darobactin export ABC transporter periplasmic adaptor subunit [Acerihabitans arboris]NDL61560.1 darobactin export ABC transporter periplasmic adaptor subunit [Acerihabitans arboris]
MDVKLDKKHGVHRRAGWITWCAVALFMLLCGWLYKLATTDNYLRMPLANVTLHPVTRGAYTDTLITRAVAMPNESVIVSSERGGKVVDIYKTSSDYVKKGEIIARLSNYDFVLQVTSRIADATEQINNLRNMRMLLERNSRDTKVELQKSHYNRQKIAKDIRRNKKLFENAIIEKAKYEDLLDELNHWEKTCAILSGHDRQQDQILPQQFQEIDRSINRLGKLVDLIKGGLEQLVIVSPIEGTLSSLDIKIGQQIKPGDKVTIVDNLHSYYFEADFSEYYLDKIKPQANVVAQAGGVEIPLTIESVSSVVDNGKFKARLRSSRPLQMVLKRGQSIDLHVFLSTQQDALLTPSEAVFFNEGQALVYVFDENGRRAVKTPVRVKRQGAAQAEITRGLTEGQQVVTFADNDYEKSNIIEFD